jgi:hypothetical protein
MMGAVLVLPPPGTTSRERDFCRSWLALSKSEQVALLERDEQREANPRRRACRERLRAGLRHTLDAECRNWNQLMDFEVRALVERVIEPCPPAPEQRERDPHSRG